MNLRPVLLLALALFLTARLPARAQQYSPPRIDRIIVTERMLRPGDTLGVVLWGTPGAHAWFDIVGVVQGVRLREVSAGRYEGQLLVQLQMKASQAAVIGHLSVQGREVSLVADQAVSIRVDGRLGPVASPPPPAGPLFANMATPTAGQLITGDFTVTGRATPMALVEVLAIIQQPVIPGMLTMGGQRFQASAHVDAAGQYSALIRLPGTLQQGSIVVKVRAVGPTGETTEWTQRTFPTVRQD